MPRNINSLCFILGALQEVLDVTFNSSVYFTDNKNVGVLAGVGIRSYGGLF